MGVADSMDQLRCNTWLLARRTRRLGRRWQGRIESLREQVPENVASLGTVVGRQIRRARRQAEMLPDTLDLAGITATATDSLSDAWGLTRRGIGRFGRQLVRRMTALTENGASTAERLEEIGERVGRIGRRTVATLPKTVDRETGRLGKVIRAGAGLAAWRSLTGRGERNKQQPIALWVGLGVTALIGGLVIANRRMTAQLRNISPTPGVNIGRYPTAFGEMAYRVVGNGQPLVLIHGIGPGTSHHVWDANIEELARHFRVYAIDLLGFGLSDKPNITYTGDRFARVISDFLRDVVGEPAIVVASGLSAGFAARTVSQHPELASALVLINPAVEMRQSLGQRLFRALSAIPMLETGAYFGMTRRNRIASRLKERFFVDPAAVTEGMVDHYYANAHQPGSHRAIRDMIAGRMNLDLACELTHVDVPISFVWGRHATQPSVEQAGSLMAAKNKAAVCIFEHSAMYPQTDESESFNQFLIHRFAEQQAGVTAPQKTKGKT